MQTGNFGQVREAYAEARLLFPQEVIDYIMAQLPSSAVVLDLGCGTGIATRQLHDQGVDVTGIDVDAEMILVAKESSPNIAYDVAPANKIPFDNDSFDAVTAFSAFHWFADEESLAEIKRILKPGGQLFVMNKNGIAGFRVGYRVKLQEFLGISLPSPKDSYDPAEILQQSGFTNFAAVSSGQEGLESIEKDCPDLILLDIGLEDIDGIEVLKRLKSNSTTADIPVIVLSNMREKDKGDQAQKLGAADYILKAKYLPREIVERVEQFLTSQTK